jgi:UDP-arabinose 4-epimerase
MTRTTMVVQGGAGYIGSHAGLRLLDDGHYKVTILDNLSRGNK